MKVESSMAWSPDPMGLKVAAAKRTVAIEITEPGFGHATIALKLTRSDAQRLADAILATMKEQA